jgi:hypothetical protein
VWGDGENVSFGELLSVLVIKIEGRAWGSGGVMKMHTQGDNLNR